MTKKTSPEWQREIDAAQRHTVDVIRRKTYPRIPYGQDYPDGKEHCWDCGVVHGQYHVVGCCVEFCARCKVRQALSCDCWLERGLIVRPH